MANVLYGITIVESLMAVNRTQVRFPKSKKRRIRAKWENRERNFKSIPQAFQMGNQIICHPSIAARLREDFPTA
jgi:hypothetical protein